MSQSTEEEAVAHLLLHSAGLTHQKSFTEVTARLLRDLLCQFRGKEEAFFFTDHCQDTTNLETRLKKKKEEQLL